MKYPPSVYARALYDVCGSSPLGEREAIVQNFKKTVKKNGDIYQHKKIIHEFEKLLVHDRGGRMITIEFARALPEAFIEKVRKFFPVHDHIEVVIAPMLVAGMRVLIDGEHEFDNSFYRKVTRLLHIE